MFVAPTSSSLSSAAVSAPSRLVRNSFLTLREDSLSPSRRWLSMESISSMKITEGWRSLASWKRAFTVFSASPIHFESTLEALTLKKVAPHSAAIQRASSVLPVPGGPYSSTPFGCATPRLSNSSGCLMGSSITSLISVICLSSPPTMSYDESGTFSTFMRLTSGSTLVGRILCSAYESLRSATRVPATHLAMSISFSTSTTYLPSGPVFTSTLSFPMAFTTSPTFEPGSLSFINSSRNARTLAFSSLRWASRRRMLCTFSRMRSSWSSILAR
mmetsp:Transcript_166740/g.405240  ORF Transcript_166740/g.405240 Transcript_166740/m.405240 type:complete len:273 (-) Transcript_166740:299-1117(-)